MQEKDVNIATDTGELLQSTATRSRLQTGTPWLRFKHKRKKNCCIASFVFLNVVFFIFGPPYFNDVIVLYFCGSACFGIFLTMKLSLPVCLIILHLEQPTQRTSFIPLKQLKASC